ncbi:hypothetical protein CEG99_19520, partial [Shigella boydii]
SDRNRSHWSTSKTPSYTKSVSWQHHPAKVVSSLVNGNICHQINNRIFKLFKWQNYETTKYIRYKRRR